MGRYTYGDGNRLGQGWVERTESFIYSADEILDIRVDDVSSISPDYTQKISRFSGEVNRVEIDIDEAAEDFDHLLTEEERYRVAMERQ